AYIALIESPDLRARFGTAARMAAEASFDWRHIIARYQELWAELAARRAASAESAPARGPVHWPARTDPFTLFADYPTEALSLRHRLEPGDVPGDFATIVDHHLFSFGKHRLRLDLCELVLGKVTERSGIDLAIIGEGLGDVDRMLLLRNAS